MNVASDLLPTIDLSYIEDRKSGISSQTFLNAWSVLKNNNRNSVQAQHLNDTSKVYFFNIGISKVYLLLNFVLLDGISYVWSMSMKIFAMRGLTNNMTVFST